MENLWKDTRYGLRSLLKRPAFTALAVLTLALGIGVNTAIFSGVSAFVLRPLGGVGEPERLFALFERSGNEESDFNHFSYPDYVDYRSQSASFEGITAHKMEQAAIGSNREQTDVVWGQIVTGNFFDVLKVRMQLGRGFRADEDVTPGAHPVIVLSNDLWRNRFGGDREIVNKTVQVNGHPFTVVGVASEDFTGSKWALGMKFWVPLMMREQVTGGTRSWITARGNHWLEVMGRLKPGVTREQAAAELTNVSTRLEQTYPDERNKNVKVLVVTEQVGRWGEVGGVVRLSSGLALAVVGLVLLVACANVGNMMLARSLVRRREFAIRIALGAGRWHVMRQLLVESILLSLAGGAIGLILAFWVTDAMTSFFPSVEYQIVLSLAPDMRSFVFTFVVSGLTGVLFGLAPALQASRPELIPVLKGESGGGPHSQRLRLRNLLVVAQIGLSLIVLVFAALLVQSFKNAKLIDPGFATKDTLIVSLNPKLFSYTKEQGRDFYHRLAERVRALPGIGDAGLVNWLPLGSDSNSWGPIYAAGQPPPPPGEGLDAFSQIVGRGYFSSLRIPLLQGRDFDEHDREGIKPESVIINETLAQRLWPNESAVGKQLILGRAEPQVMEVIAVARNTRIRNLGEEPRSQIFISVDQTYSGGLSLVTRTSSDQAAAIKGIREVLKELDPRMPIYNVKTIEQHLTWAFWAQNMAASLSTAFGLLALVLASTGLYGVISYTIVQRTHEIGIRLALGAQLRDVLTLILSQGMKLALIGVLLGLGGSFALTSLLSSLLFGIKPTDALTFATVSLVLLMFALVACYIPARRATKVDPLVALRYE